MTVHFDALRIVFEPVKIGALHVESQCRTPSLDSAVVDTFDSNLFYWTTFP